MDRDNGCRPSWRRVGRVAACASSLLLGALISCAPGPVGCSGPLMIGDLPAAPKPLDEQARAQAADLPLSDYTDDVIDALLEGTGLSAEAAAEGGTSVLVGTYNTIVQDLATGAPQQAQLQFDSTGAVTELRLFGDELTEQVVVGFPEQAPQAKATVEGILLGTRVSTTDGQRFEITIMAIFDTREGDLTVRTRETIQSVVALAPDPDTLVGVSRHSLGVIASQDGERPVGQILTAAGATVLARD